MLKDVDGKAARAFEDEDLASLTSHDNNSLALPESNLFLIAFALVAQVACDPGAGDGFVCGDAICIVDQESLTLFIPSSNCTAGRHELMRTLTGASAYIHPQPRSVVRVTFHFSPSFIIVTLIENISRYLHEGRELAYTVPS
jgi:hypothetical protein